VDEANIAFELNGGLFAALRPKRAAIKTESEVPQHPHIHRVFGSARPPLGDPTTPVVSPTTPPKQALSKQLPILIAQNVDDKSTSSSEKTYPVSTVITFIGAVCLAHFFLVVSGTIGSKGLVSTFFSA
jgi:heme oxygenase (biliverdin-producing, ferredoxin)